MEQIKQEVFEGLVEVRDGLVEVGITYTATYNGRGEFYSGIKNGEEVLLTIDDRWSVSIQSLKHRGASLALFDLKNITNIKRFGN
jgi:hypothetical protein